MTPELLFFRPPWHSSDCKDCKSLGRAYDTLTPKNNWRNTRVGSAMCATIGVAQVCQIVP